MTRVRLDAIAIDAGTQVRARLDEAVVAEYAERMTEGDAFPPLVVFTDGTCSADGSPRYFLGDGFHRTMAARKNGALDLDADVRHGTKSDALWFALGANRANGHQMTAADKRHAILLALQAWPEKSARELSDQIGCNQDYVSEVRRQVKGTLHLPDRVTGKDGKSYPASRSLTISPNGETQISPIGETAAPSFKSRAAVEERHRRMREMAAEGHTSRQIASALGLSEEGCRGILREQGIDVIADRVVGKRRRHDANRIVERMTLDAEHLTADVSLIEFDQLDRVRLGDWIDSLTQSRRALHGFIQRLLKEQQKHGEAA